MKIDKMMNLFKDPELITAITAGKKEEVSEKDFAKNLLASDPAKLEANTLKFIQILEQNAKNDGACLRILVTFKKESAKCKDKLTPKVLAESERVFNLFEKKIAKKEDKKEKKEANSAAGCVDIIKLAKEQEVPPYQNDGPLVHFDKFPKEDCLVGDLRKRAAELSKDTYKEAEQIVREISRRAKVDPTIKAITQNDAKKEAFKSIASSYNPPFDFNRTGRDLTDGYLNASDVRMFDRQNYILSGLVKNPAQTRDYFEAAVKQGTCLFVSAHETGEASSRSHNFWKNEVLSKVTFRDGTTLTNITDKDPKGEKTEQQKKRISHIVKNHIKATNGKSENKSENKSEKMITHLHIDGWRDHNPMHDQALYETLLDEMQRISPSKDVPVAINCKGGVGRTGTIAIGLYLRREVDAQVLAGTPLDEINVNVPEAIYKFRLQRQGMLNRSLQFVQLYTMLANYVDRIKSKQEWQPSPPQRGTRYFIEYAKAFKLLQ